MGTRGWEDNKGTWRVSLAWHPKLDPQNSCKGRKREPTPQKLFYDCTCVLWHVCLHPYITHTHTRTITDDLTCSEKESIHLCSGVPRMPVLSTLQSQWSHRQGTLAAEQRKPCSSLDTKTTPAFMKPMYPPTINDVLLPCSYLICI